MTNIPTYLFACLLTSRAYNIVAKY